MKIQFKCRQIYHMRMLRGQIYYYTVYTKKRKHKNTKAQTCECLGDPPPDKYNGIYLNLTLNDGWRWKWWPAWLILDCEECNWGDADRFPSHSGQKSPSLPDVESLYLLSQLFCWVFAFACYYLLCALPWVALMMSENWKSGCRLLWCMVTQQNHNLKKNM